MHSAVAKGRGGRQVSGCSRMGFQGFVKGPELFLQGLGKVFFQGFLRRLHKGRARGL